MKLCGKSSATIEQVSDLVQRLYALVAEFEALFSGRKFTPDGHLVGSIGKVIAAHRCDLRLFPSSSKSHDGAAQDRRPVEIKAIKH